MVFERRASGNNTCEADSLGDDNIVFSTISNDGSFNVGVFDVGYGAQRSERAGNFDARRRRRGACFKRAGRAPRGVSAVDVA